MSNITMTPIPQNYKNNVDWILGAYTDAGVSFTNGFQKDAIQNAAGARKSNKWVNWSCDISYVENEHGTYVIVEDCGTVGLTGKNLSTTEVNLIMSQGGMLESSERLARFTSMFNSGGNVTGGGLFGAGKSVYSVASKTYKYYFDSLREDQVYVANVNDCGQVMTNAYEGQDAKKYIKNSTGLASKKKVGTRIIIENPREELVESIKTKDIVKDIQESWWLIIQRLDETSHISVNGEPVGVPDGITAATHVFNLPKPELAINNTHYRVKNAGIYVFDNGENIFKGISYYRKGMKIGEIGVTDIPEKIKNKYWGYIEVDEEWESELAQIEDKVHFGVSKGKKQKNAYQYLRIYCTSKFKANLIEWGYIKDKENEDKKLREELKQIAEDIQDLFDKLGFEDLGKGPQKADFDVRWQDVCYPHEKNMRVTTNEKLTFAVRVSSTYAAAKKFDYSLKVINPQNKTIVSEIQKGSFTINSNDFVKESFELVIDTKTSEQFAENRIVLSVSANGTRKEKIKEISYFYDIDKPDNSRDTVTLALHSCTFPTTGSRRVNFEESLSNVSYRIDNKRNYPLKYRLNVSIHNATDSACPKIVDVAFLEGCVKPYEEEITTSLSPIIFETAIYEKYLSVGILELRARLIAVEDDDDFEKGDKVTKYHFPIYLNCDEKHGKSDAFEIKSVVAPDNFKRSWYEAGSNRTIYLNVGHVAYMNTQEYQDIQHDYMREQMLKQYVLLYLAEGRFDMFGGEGDDFRELEPQEAADKVISKIESVYYESLK